MLNQTDAAGGIIPRLACYGIDEELKRDLPVFGNVSRLVSVPVLSLPRAKS
jgi:hypothetical protein